MTKRKTTRNSGQGKAKAKTARTRQNASAPQTTAEKKTPARQSNPSGNKATKNIMPAEQDKSSFREKKVGSVYRGNTKYIDTETKEERNYVVVVDDGKNVSVAKLKSIKIFDENGKNADRALVEINATRYGLEKRTGVDFQVFNKNRMSKKPLQLEDKDVFPEGEERFKLGSHDLSRTLRHTGKAGSKKKRGK